MTREQAKELLPVITAWADGKQIEWLNNETGKWMSFELEHWPFFEEPHKWRIEPEPRRWWIWFPANGSGIIAELDDGPPRVRAKGDILVHVQEILP